jgi:hypothetical protein
MDSKWSSGQTESSKDGDATGSSQKPNENNVAESSIDPSKMTDLERQIWEQLKGKSAGGADESTKH